MNRQEAEELLPWFVAGSLSEEEARAVQAFIDSGEISMAEVAELELLVEAVAEQAAGEPAYDPAILARAAARLGNVVQEQPARPTAAAMASTTSSWTSRLLDRLEWSRTPTFARLALAAQLLVVVGLAATLMLPSAEEQTYGVVAGPPASGLTADLSVSFAPDATEAELRALLTAARTTIVAGPSALGIYQLDVAADGDVAAALATLRDSPLVTFAERAAEP